MKALPARQRRLPHEPFPKVLGSDFGILIASGEDEARRWTIKPVSDPGFFAYQWTELYLCAEIESSPRGFGAEQAIDKPGRGIRPLRSEQFAKSCVLHDRASQVLKFPVLLTGNRKAASEG